MSSNNVKDNKDIQINKVDDIEKMLGEFREAALVINHENRKKKVGGEEDKEDVAYGTFKKKNNGVPKSLRMVDMESERYQEEKKKKIQSGAISNEDPIENRSWMKCCIF